MKFSLLDSNVWVALAMERHEHHSEALAWFNEIPDDGSAYFCRMTQNSFLRLVSSKSIFQEDALINESAISALRQFQSDPRVGWLDEPFGIEEIWLSHASAKTHSPKRWMDAYLCAFAKLSKVKLVTFDDGFEQYESNGLDLVLLKKKQP